MIIYLYVKTHNITSMKYLGKTISKDPYSYKGSGIVWTRHLNKHGFNISTEIIRECTSEDELVQWGRYYSKLWNVVESPEWANLKEEAGPRGAWSDESKLKLSQFQKNKLANMSVEDRAARTKNSCSSPKSWTPERIRKISENTLGKKKTKSDAVLAVEEQRRNRTSIQKLKCGDTNRGKTWKLVDGKRIWLPKED